MLPPGTASDPALPSIRNESEISNVPVPLNSTATSTPVSGFGITVLRFELTDVKLISRVVAVTSITGETVDVLVSELGPLIVMETAPRAKNDVPF
jgi:hypothetical protein